MPAVPSSLTTFPILADNLKSRHGQSSNFSKRFQLTVQSKRVHTGVNMQSAFHCLCIFGNNLDKSIL
jgi:hypothetical protein